MHTPRLVALLIAAAPLFAAACSTSKPVPASAPVIAKPVSPALPEGALHSGELDALLTAAWTKAGVTPAPDADDSEFLRRVTLDLTGHIPTLDETRTFLADKSADKRARLVDRLLQSPAYAEHYADLYGDLLFGAEARKRILKQYDPRDVLVRAFSENWRYDQLAKELLTASGFLNENPALAFIAARLRGGGGIEAVAGSTARVFLGLQIQCAQCHDHPYDTRWKQEDFYGLVAYFARTKAKNEPMMEGAGLSLFDVRRGEAKFRRPRTEVDRTVTPRFLGRAVAGTPSETRRQTLVRAIIASDLFAKSMVTRTWTQLFGRSLVEPWDDLGGERDGRHPTTLVRLSEDFRAHGFDIRHLLRTIVLSSAYGRSSAPAPGTPDDQGAAVRAFARAAVRPLSAEQLFATLVAATGADEMARQKLSDEAAEKKLRQAFREYEFAFMDDELGDTDAFNGSVPQALLLLNGELTNTRAPGKRAQADAPVGVLSRALDSADPAARLESLFLSVYSRPPTADERASLLPALQAAPFRDRRPWEDLHFALVTSAEAVTNH